MTTKTITTLLGAFFLLFSFHGYAQSSGKPYEISGRVMDNELKVPLEYATVSIVNANNSQDITGGVTNAKGVFKIEVAPGAYNVLVEFISYESKKFNNRTINSEVGS